VRVWRTGLAYFGCAPCRSREDVPWEKWFAATVGDRYWIRVASFACIASGTCYRHDSLLEPISPWAKGCCTLPRPGARPQAGTLSVAAQKWADLFQAEFEILLYDLTSTYFEGAMAENPMPSTVTVRDKGRTVCQVVIALVITTVLNSLCL